MIRSDPPCGPIRRALRRTGLALLIPLAVAAPPACRGGIDAELDRARAFQEDRQYQQSVPRLQQILEEQPEHPEANYLLGVALLQTGHRDAAVAPLRRAAASPEYASTGGILLASLLNGTRDFAGAEAAASGVLEADPSNPAALGLRAQAKLGRRDFEGAIEDLDRLLAARPDSLNGLLLRAGALFELGRLDESDQAYQRLVEAGVAAGDVSVAGRACAARAEILSLRSAPRTEADEFMEGCLAEYGSDLALVQVAAEYFTRRGEAERAEQVWREALAQAPDSAPFRVGLGIHLWGKGETAEAEAILRAAAEELDRPQIWGALADLYRRAGRLDRAEEILSSALERTGGSEFLRLKQADLWIDTGRLDEAEALAESFEQPAYREFVTGRIRLERGDPAGALAAFDEGFASWPDNAGAHALAGRAAERLGLVERAFDEYRAAMREQAGGTEAPLAAARLAFSLGRWPEAAEFAEIHVRTHPYRDPDAYLIGARASLEGGDVPRAREFLQALERQGALAQAVAERSRLEERISGVQAGERAVLDSGLDLTAVSSEPALRALVDLRVRAGRGEEGLAVVERALAAHPGTAAFLDLRGRALVALGRSAEGEQAFRAALAADADFAPSHAALGALALRRGALDEALAHFDRAVAAAPGDVESAYRAARILLERGDGEGAQGRLRAVLARDPMHVGAANDLAWLLAERGESLDEALALARRAARGPDPDPAILDTLAAVRLARHEPDEAVAVLQAGLERHPASGTLRYRLGLAQAAQGDTRTAGETLRRALGGGPFPEADDARAALARLEQSP